jgi:toxin ParE1/3/4
MADNKSLYQVLLTGGAEQDLESIHDYIAEHDSIFSANYVLDEIMKIAESLAKFPERGSYPKELLDVGIKEYRQLAFKPYRMIYRVVNNDVVIYVIVDERRDLQSLLERRLLNS